MSGLAPILDRIASIESRFARAVDPPPQQQALGTTGVQRAATTPAGAWSTVSFDQVMSAAEAALPVLSAGSADAPFAAEFTRSGSQHGVPAELLAAVGWVESRYNPAALSPDGAIGVMQLMPGTAAGLGVDPHDPSAAIDGAARLLRGHHDRFGSWDLALAAYFSGAGAVAGNGNQATPRGAEYAQRVIERMENS